MAVTLQTTKNLNHFIQANQATWSRLEYLLEQLPYGSLHKNELDELGSVYRQVSSHLAYAQTYFPNHETTQYLNHLVIRAHNNLYGIKKKGFWREVFRFFTYEFPILFYQRSRFFYLAAFLLFAGFLLAFTLTYVDKEYAAYFLPSEIYQHVDPKQVENQPQWNHAIVSSEIMVNNIRVAFFCFVFGILLGIGTVLLLLMNGMLLGALAALYHQADGGFIFWAYIWPHGVIELTAIFIAGAAGIALAYRIFVPGDLTRRHAIVKEGKVTIKLILGVIPMFILAGIIEGYITPAPLPHWVKYLVALVTLLFLLVYFGWPFFRYGISLQTKDKVKE